MHQGSGGGTGEGMINGNDNVEVTPQRTTRDATKLSKSWAPNSQGRAKNTVSGS